MSLSRQRDDLADRFWWRADALCGSAPLGLVDAAFRSPGSVAGRTFRTQFCAVCPVWELCLREAMDTGEAGIWGGTSPNNRTHAGSRKFNRARPDPARLRRH